MSTTRHTAGPSPAGDRPARSTPGAADDPAAAPWDAIGAWATTHAQFLGFLVLCGLAFWALHVIARRIRAHRQQHDATDSAVRPQTAPSAPPGAPGGAAEPPVPQPPPSARTLTNRWKRACRDLDQIARRHAEVEEDPLELLGLPALADTAFDPTATFRDRFHAALALATPDRPDDERVGRFVAAVREAATSWSRAREAAEAAGESRFTGEEQAMLRRARAALELAESAPAESRRRNAYRTAAAHLRDLERSSHGRGGGWTVPGPLRAQLDEWAADPGR